MGDGATGSMMESHIRMRLTDLIRLSEHDETHASIFIFRNHEDFVDQNQGKSSHDHELEKV